MRNRRLSHLADFTIESGRNNQNWVKIIAKQEVEKRIIGDKHKDEAGYTDQFKPGNNESITDKCKPDEFTITPISAIFLFHPKSWSILDWLFSRF